MHPTPEPTPPRTRTTWTMRCMRCHGAGTDPRRRAAGKLLPGGPDIEHDGEEPAATPCRRCQGRGYEPLRAPV